MSTLTLYAEQTFMSPWVFHVMVSGRYTDWRESKMRAGEQLTSEDSEIGELSVQQP